MRFSIVDPSNLKSNFLLENLNEFIEFRKALGSKHTPKSIRCIAVIANEQ